MFKPLLAPNDDPMRNPEFFNLLKYPLLASPKLDGIRCVTHSGGCMSRTNKQLPNKHLQMLLSGFQGLDGELLLGNPKDFDVYNRTQSVVMSHDKAVDDLAYYVFDVPDMELASLPFEERLKVAHERVSYAMLQEGISGAQIRFVTHALVENYEQLIKFEAAMLREGFEGIMLRDPQGEYKHGRSTMRQGHLIKLKRFQDDEALLLDVIEQMKNNNPEFENETGHTERSTRKEGMAGANTLGKLLVDYNGMELEISCGTLKHNERQEIWDNPERYIGAHLTFRHFTHGVKEKPRFPRFVGWRDMSHM